MDVYIVPKHVYEKYDEKEITKYNGQDGVGSGPYDLTEFKKGQFARFEANPNYWRGKPPLAAVVIRNFNNADAMVAALRSGEIDAAQRRARRRVRPARGRRGDRDRRGQPGRVPASSRSTAATA